MSAADDVLGGIWAVIATVFVYRDQLRRQRHRRSLPDGGDAAELLPVPDLPAVLPVGAVGLAAMIGVSGLSRDAAR